MNRSALNSVVLGSGSSPPWITIAAQQVFSMVGTCRFVAMKYIKSASQSFTLSDTSRFHMRVGLVAQQAFALTSTVTLRALKKVYASAVQVVRLSSVVKFRRGVAMSAAQTFSLTSDALFRPWRAIHVSASQALRLTSTAVFKKLTAIHFSAVQTLQILSDVVFKRRTPMSAAQAFTMATEFRGQDYYTGPAPLDRTLDGVDIRVSTRTLDPVEIGVRNGSA